MSTIRLSPNMRVYLVEFDVIVTGNRFCGGDALFINVVVAFRGLNRILYLGILYLWPIASSVGEEFIVGLLLLGRRGF